MTKNIGHKKTKEKPSRKKVLLTIICIFLALVIIFGITFGIILWVKNAKAVVSYKGTRLTEGECKYLASSYKYRFLSELVGKGAYDDPDFWNSKYDQDATYGDLLKEKTEAYIRNVTVAAYIFDSYCKLEKSDKTNIARAVREVLDYKADGSEDKFDSLSEQYGFTFKDFESVTELLYKAQFVMARIYGVDGSNMQSYTAECNEYFDTYSHVKLLFIRTEDKFSLDADGNRERDENNEDIKIPLTPSEVIEREALIGDIVDAIDAYENGGDLGMTSSHFNALLSEHDEGDPYMRNTGYYFSAESEYSREFSEEYPEIVAKALEMEIESYERLDLSGGVVCFIYKYANIPFAYTDTSEGGCFEDFYALAAEHSFYDAVNELVGDVKIKDSFFDIDFAGTPYNYELIPRF